MVKHIVRLFVLVAGLVVSSDASAQITHNQAPPDTINLSGPRIGMTMLSPGVMEQLRADFGVEVGSVISQFGWQKEKRFLSTPSGFTGVTEFVFLVGGVDQGVILPSFNWLVGARTANGLEFAAGPNVTPAGLAMVIAGGMTFQTGNLNIPFNVAVVPSRHGARMSFLIGFNGRK
jgi:hypothetical protein